MLNKIQRFFERFLYKKKYDYIVHRYTVMNSDQVPIRSMQISVYKNDTYAINI